MEGEGEAFWPLQDKSPVLHPNRPAVSLSAGPRWSPLRARDLARLRQLQRQHALSKSRLYLAGIDTRWQLESAPKRTKPALAEIIVLLALFFGLPQALRPWSLSRYLWRGIYPSNRKVPKWHS